ncbi:hypothetical protein [Gelidibacter japonicus]|uniref:hypothetical protein n=1 Tax=Gelidibacter japonicus TaxID=1962232 RepID=UPI003A8DFE78
MNSEITTKLIKIIMLILLISYGLDKIVFFSLNKISDQVMTGQAIGKLNHFLTQKETADFIVFGNSRANRHIDVNLFSKNGFNMGVDGIGIAYNSTLIRTLPMDKQQFILVHIDTSNFFDDDYDGSDIKALKAKYQRDSNITKALNKSGQISLMHHFYNSMNYNGNSIGIIKNYFRPNYDYRTYNGYDPILVSESQEGMRDEILSKAFVDEECPDSLKVNPIALDYLRSIKSFSEKAPNKTFLFITSPIFNDSCNMDNAKLNEIMQDLGLTYWDFSNLYKDNKDNGFWKDSKHMSQKGAEAFSLYLLHQYKTSKI